MANENRYFKTPFAETGSRSEVPDNSVSGAVGYDTGYGSDYELPQGNPARRRIERDEFNGVLHSVTENLKQIQEKNYPTWIEDDGELVPSAFSYDKGVIVNHSGENWISNENANQDEPGVGAKWSKYTPSVGGSLDTLTQLRQFYPVDGAVWVSGYHVRGDDAFGSNIFKWDPLSTLSDNGGTIIKLDGVASGRYKLQYTGGVNIKWFGAVDDISLINDSLLAIDNAIDRSLITGEGIYVPSGRYLYSGNKHIVIPEGVSFAIRGDGASSIIHSTGSGKVFDVFSKGYLNSQMFYVSDVRFETVAKDSTMLYVSNDVTWGGHINIVRTVLDGFETCIHGIRLFNSIFSNLFLFGSGSDESGANIRIWGADGTLTEQDHSFSNLNKLDTISFWGAQTGLDLYGFHDNIVEACTFQYCDYGIITRANRDDVGGPYSGTLKCGYGLSSFQLNSCWLERNLYSHIVLGEVDFITNTKDANNVDYKAGGISGMGNVFDAPDRFLDQADGQFGITSGDLAAFKNYPSDGDDNPYFQAFYNNKDGTPGNDGYYAHFSQKKAWLATPIVTSGGISFDTPFGDIPDLTSLVRRYHSSTVSPELYVGNDLKLVGDITWQSYVGDIATVKITFFSNSYPGGGTGDVQIRGLHPDLTGTCVSTFIYAGSLADPIQNYYVNSIENGVANIKKIDAGSTSTYSNITNDDVLNNGFLFVSLTLAIQLTGYAP